MNVLLLFVQWVDRRACRVLLAILKNLERLFINYQYFVINCAVDAPIIKQNTIALIIRIHFF